LVSAFESTIALLIFSCSLNPENRNPTDRTLLCATQILYHLAAVDPTQGGASPMSYLQIAILALIQGAAELLPVSSSAHVILAERLMGLDPSTPELTFLLVMLHTGTMFAVILYFWPRWRALLWASPDSAPRFHFLKMIVVATACTGIVGLGLKFLIENVILVRLLGHEKGEVEHLFKNLPLIGTALFTVGILILVAGSWEAQVKQGGLTLRSSIGIGIVQGLCLPFRGFSRSGATISTALLQGVPRARAEDFSFALAVVLTPPVIVLEVHRLLKAREWLAHESAADLLLPGLVGMGFSFVAGLAALRVLSAALEKGRWSWFGYYCMGAACVVFAGAFGFGL
jgi:undecaprenyl-diphosphatase